MWQKSTTKKFYGGWGKRKGEKKYEGVGVGVGRKEGLIDLFINIHFFHT
jgi:hypothetical protein